MLYNMMKDLIDSLIRCTLQCQKNIIFMTW